MLYLLNYAKMMLQVHRSQRSSTEI